MTQVLKEELSVQVHKGAKLGTNGNGKIIFVWKGHRNVFLYRKDRKSTILSCNT